MTELVIVGAGGFGRETVDTVKAINASRPKWRIIGVVDDEPSAVNLERLGALGLPFLGGIDVVPHNSSVALCIGNPAVRRDLAMALHRVGADFPSLIHPSTTIGSKFTHGTGLITLAGASIGTNVTLGDHVHLNAHSVVGHDAHLHDFVSVNPNATVSGGCRIGNTTLLGASSTVLQDLSVGSSACLGAGACAVRDVPSNTTVVGVPARPLSKAQSAT